MSDFTGVRTFTVNGLDVEATVTERDGCMCATFDIPPYGAPYLKAETLAPPLTPALTTRQLLQSKGCYSGPKRKSR